MELLFLGTSAMVPTKTRNHSAIFLSHQGEGVLLDCGEGTQRQLRIAGIRPTRITRICISHWDGDHIFGLPGLLQTLSNSKEKMPISIYGPRGFRKDMARMMEAFPFDNQLDIEIKEGEGIMLDGRLHISSFSVEHKIPTVGFIVMEKGKLRINVARAEKEGITGRALGELQDGKDIVWKGKTVRAADITYPVPPKKVVYIPDTLFCKACIANAQDADLIICDSTYAADLEEKAAAYKHMTAAQAGQVANLANAKKLILTHFSQRYKSPKQLIDDARLHFSNVAAAHDFMKVKV